MAVELTVESLDKVSDENKGVYVKGNDGKFHLDPDLYAELKAEGLKRKNAELLGKFRASKTSEERVVELEQELRHFKLTTPLRELALKAGMLPDRIDFAIGEISKRFALDDSGRIVTLDEYGEASNIPPARFLETIYKEKFPFLYGASNASGSGASNSHKGQSHSSKTMKRSAFEALSGEEQMRFSVGGGTLTDD